MELADLQLEHFVPLLDQTFVGDFGEQGTIDLVLTEAVDKPTGHPGEVAFSLVFRGPTDRTFGQGMVPLRHEAIGEQGIFMTVVAENSEGRFYEAVFTRVVD